jgi:hypothetical protein
VLFAKVILCSEDCDRSIVPSSARINSHLPALPKSGYLCPYRDAHSPHRQFAMPALSNQDGFLLDKREWSNTVGQSGMTPTAFAFLVPVFVVVVFAPL